MHKKSKDGFLKIYRRFFDHFLWNEKREYSKAEAWIDLLRSARYTEGETEDYFNTKLISWGRGELVASIRFLKERWKWGSNGKVKRFLDLLADREMIEIRTEQGQNVISVCNYSTYNPLPDDRQNADRTGAEQGQNGDRTLTEQNSKKVNKANKVKKGRDSVATSGSDFPDSCTFLPEAKSIANELAEAIKNWDPQHRYNFKDPVTKAWVLEIERAMRLDGRTAEQLRFMIEYIFTQPTDVAMFWAPNIQSGKKLRSKFDKMKNQIKKEAKNARRKQPRQSAISKINELEFD